MLELGLKPSDILTREAFEDAIHCNYGSRWFYKRHSSLTCHCPRGQMLTCHLRDFNTIQERVPHLADLVIWSVCLPRPLRSWWVCLRL